MKELGEFLALITMLLLLVAIAIVLYPEQTAAKVGRATRAFRAEVASDGGPP